MLIFCFVLLSGVKQSESVVCVSILFQILSHIGCCRVPNRVPWAVQ